MGLKSFSHDYGQCAFHIVFVPTYMYRRFVGFGVKSCCKKALRNTACRLGCEVFALQVSDDHVNIFVGLHPDCFCF